MIILINVRAFVRSRSLQEPPWGPCKFRARVEGKNLIKEKRRQVIEGAVQAFKRKSYHIAKVRENARQSRGGRGRIWDCVRSEDGILSL